MRLRAHNNHRRRPSYRFFTFLFSLPSFSPAVSFSVILCDVRADIVLLFSLGSLSAHLQVFGFEEAEIGNNKTQFLFWLYYIFSFTSFSSVFFIHWPEGPGDPERDEQAEAKNWGFEHVMLYYSLTRTHTHAGRRADACTRAHQLLCQRDIVNVELLWAEKEKPVALFLSAGDTRGRLSHLAQRKAGDIRERERWYEQGWTESQKGHMCGGRTIHLKGFCSNAAVILEFSKNINTQKEIAVPCVRDFLLYVLVCFSFSPLKCP